MSKRFDPMLCRLRAFCRVGLHRPRSFVSARALVLGWCAALVTGSGALLWANAWHRPPTDGRPGPGAPVPSARATDNGPAALALLPHQGHGPADIAIQRLQAAARSAPHNPELLTRLGWAFVTKARLSGDPGFYKLAEQCALAVRSQNADEPDALLLQGHLLQSLHRFKEAESLARQLVAMRQNAFDHALLGDALMEQGHLAEAVTAYQKMVDLKPSLQAYTRIGHLRWLKGDLEGALEALRLAVTAASPREPEPAAWAYTRLGLYALQTRDLQTAERAAHLALEFAPDYAAALLLRGRIRLAEGQAAEALAPLERAATLVPLPDYQWALAEALREAGQGPRAEAVEAALARDGATNDSRTFALYLATRGQQVERSLALAREELNCRQDVFTLDALAWALQANGRSAEAQAYSKESLREGTQDARLFYHAGSLARASGDEPEAQRWLGRAADLQQMLLPSERTDLHRQLAALSEGKVSRALSPGH
jgi:tetratricopeptide (TPR) repeat protein